MKRVLVFTSAIFLSSAMAQDLPPQKFKEWQFEQKDKPATALELGTTCLASTSKLLETDTWTLSVIASPSRAFPVAMVISSTAKDLPAALSLQTDSTSAAYLFYKLENLDNLTSGSSYLYISKSLPQLYSLLRKDNSARITVKKADKVVKVPLSLSGSTLALDQVSKTCAGGSDYIFADFFKYIEALKVDPSTVVEAKGSLALWSSLSSAWTAYFQTGVTAAQIKSIQKQIDPLVKQQQDYLRSNGLLNQKIKDKDALKKDLESQVAEYSARKAQYESDIKDEEKNLEAKKTILDAKTAVFKPIADEGKPYFDAYETADDQLDSANSRIAAARSESSDLESKISSLQSELRSLQNDINKAEADLSYAKSRRIQAQSDLNRFNFDFELRQRVASDSTIISYQNSINSIQSDLESLRRDSRQAHGQVEDLKRRLRDCQATPNSDCTSIISDLDRAERNENNIEGQMQDKRRAIEDLQVQIERRKFDIGNDVKAYQDQLAARVTKADQDIADIESDIRASQNRQAAIRNIDIPEAQNRIVLLNNTVLTLQGQLPALQSALFEAKKALELFKARTDYDRKKNEYQTAWNEFNASRDSLNRLQSSLANVTASLNNLQSRLAKAKAELETLIANAAAGEEALRGVEANLLTLNTEKTRLNALLVDQQNTFKTSAVKAKFLMKDLEDSTPKMDKIFWSTLTPVNDWVL